MNEQLTQAKDSADFALSHLQQALAKSDAVEALLLYPMIATARKLSQDIEALLSAAEAEL